MGLFCFAFSVAQDSLEKVTCLILMAGTARLLLQTGRTGSLTRDRRVDRCPLGNGILGGKLNLLLSPRREREAVGPGRSLELPLWSLEICGSGMLTS